MAELLERLTKFYREEMDTEGKTIVIGRDGYRTELCLYISGTRPDCPFCDKVFADHNAFIDHLLITRRNINSKLFNRPGNIFSRPHRIRHVGELGSCPLTLIEIWLLKYFRFSDPIAIRYHARVLKVYQEKLDPYGKKLLVGTGDCCVYIRDARPKCPFCKQVFANSNAFIDHLMMTYRGSNRSDLPIKHRYPSSEPSSADTVMHTAHGPNECSTFGAHTPTDVGTSSASTDFRIASSNAESSTAPLNVFTELVGHSGRHQGIYLFISIGNLLLSMHLSIAVFRFSDPVDIADLFTNLTKYYQEELIPDSIGIVIGRQGGRIETCLDCRYANPMCPFCKRYFRNAVGVLGHLLFTRRCKNSRVVRNPANPTFTSNMSTYYEQAGGSAPRQGLRSLTLFKMHLHEM